MGQGVERSNGHFAFAGGEGRVTIIIDTEGGGTPTLRASSGAAPLKASTPKPFFGEIRSHWDDVEEMENLRFFLKRKNDYSGLRRHNSEHGCKRKRRKVVKMRRRLFLFFSSGWTTPSRWSG